METVSQVCRSGEACCSRSAANGNTIIGNLRPDEKPERKMACNFATIRNTHIVRTVGLGATGKLVGAKAIDQTDGVITTQCVVIADTPCRSVGIVVTCLDKTQNAIRTRKSYRTPAREGIGSLQSCGVVVRGPNPINALVRDVVATKTRDGSP